MLDSLGQLLWNAHWDRWATVASAILTAFAFVAAVWALIQNKKAIQLQIFESIFKDVRELEKEYYTSYDKKDPDKQQQWLSLLFNTLEYIAFLFNSKRLPKGDFLKFYQNALLDSHKIFVSLIPKPTQEDPQAYSEFKKLIKSIR